MIEFSVHGQPQAQGNHRINRSGRIYDSNRELKEWRYNIAWAARLAMGATDGVHFRGPVSVRVVFSLKPPKKWDGKSYPTKRPDIDKLMRAICDGMTEAGVYADDSQVIYSAGLKVYVGQLDALDEPGILATVSAIE
jgi:crossover junction endodeoxyribonuclease RusA